MNMMTNTVRGCDLVVNGLRAEFGAVLADRIIEAEALDFLWDARVRERYLGQHFGSDFDDEDACLELSRVATLSVLESRWYVGMCLINDNGVAVELLWKRRFNNRTDAESNFLRAR